MMFCCLLNDDHTLDWIPEYREWNGPAEMDRYMLALQDRFLEAQTSGVDPWRIGEFIDPEFTVSTVFLGVGPLPFETMYGTTESGDLSFDRYPTWDTAKQGHDTVVANLKAWAES
jgi:hypothetical protein